MKPALFVFALLAAFSLGVFSARLSHADEPAAHRYTIKSGDLGWEIFDTATGDLWVRHPTVKETLHFIRAPLPRD